MTAFLVIIISLTKVSYIEIANSESICIWRFYIIGACTKNAYFGDISTRNTNTSDTFVRSTYIKRVCTKNRYSDGAFIETSTCIKNNCAKITYTKIAGTIEYSRIDSKFFQILELKLFSIRLKIRVGTC